nr:hypothetical protein [Tanacetum cinerariifolium]
MTSLTSLCELACQIVQKNLEEKQLEEEQAAKAQSWKLLVCYDDDDDKESSNSLEDNIISGLPSYSAVTTSEPIDSLSMRDEHLNTIPATESDEFIKSCVENLVPNPSESEGKMSSLSDEDFLKNIYSNPLFDEEIISMEIDQHSFNAESDLIESMPNHDSSVIISSKIDSLFDEFTGELTLLKSIPLGIDETYCHPEKEIRLTKRLFDTLMEDIDLSFSPDDPMPPGIEEDDDDSERDIPILEELPENYSLSLPNTESYHFDIPSPYRPPVKPPDGNTGTLNIKMMGDVSDQKVPIHNLTITRVSNQEKSPAFLSNQGLEAFQPSAECSMMIINGKNIPLLDVPLFHFYPLDQLKYEGISPDDPMPPGIKEDDDDSERDIPILEEFPDNYSI